MDSRTRDARRYAGWSGIAFVVLFGVGSALWALGEWPEAGAPAAEIVDFYSDTSDRIVIGASLSLLGVGAFLLFAAALRQVLTEAEGNDLLATTAFGGALLGLAAGLGAETINMVGALRAADGELSPSLAQAVHEIPQILGSTAAGLGIGVFALATAAVTFRTSVLPPLVGLALGVLGLALVTPVSQVREVSGTAMIVIALTIAVTLLRTPADSVRRL